MHPALMGTWRLPQGEVRQRVLSAQALDDAVCEAVRVLLPVLVCAVANGPGDGGMGGAAEHAAALQPGAAEVQLNWRCAEGCSRRSRMCRAECYNAVCCAECRNAVCRAECHNAVCHAICHARCHVVIMPGVMLGVVPGVLQGVMS